MIKNQASEIHDLTRAEIAHQIAQLNERRRAIVKERAELYAKQRHSSTGPIFNDDELAARVHAKTLLNGSAPADLLPHQQSGFNIDIDRKLDREQRGIDIALKILSDKNLVAVAAEAVAWEEDHRAEWCQLAREVILAMTRLEALKKRAVSFLETCPDLHAVKLRVELLTLHLDPISLHDLPLDDLKAVAIAERVASAADFERARNGKISNG